jgi:mono/diheme cytochrome c family protein
MKHKVFGVVAVALAVAVLCAGARPAKTTYSQGKALYKEKCMICHGVNGKGNGPAADALSKPPRNFNDPEFWKKKDVDQFIRTQVKKGSAEMPAFSLNDGEITAIIDYMSQAFGKKKPAQPPNS